MRRLSHTVYSIRSFLLVGCIALNTLTVLPIITPPAYAARHTLEKILVIVNNEAITNDDFNQYKKITLRQLSHSNIKLPPEKQLNAQLLDRLINERIQLQVAEQTGLQVSDEQLSDSLKRIAEDSHMTVSQLMEGLHISGISVARFREEIRREILLNRLQEREIGARVHITDADIDQYWKEQEKNLQDRKIATPTVPQYHVRHILIKVNEAMPDSEAKQKAENIYHQLLKHPDQFATLAEQNSEDRSAPQGGDLGWINQGDTVPEFEHAMLQLKPHQITEPIRTPFGYHIIELLETRQYDPVKNHDKLIARNAIRARKMEEAFTDWLKQLRAKAIVEYRTATPPDALPTAGR